MVDGFPWAWILAVTVKEDCAVGGVAGAWRSWPRNGTFAGETKVEKGGNYSLKMGSCMGRPCASRKNSISDRRTVWFMKKLIKRIVPRVFWPSTYFESLIKERSGMRVIAGPFEEMKYVRRAIGSALLPKLLGIYERELHPVVNQIIATGFDNALDVGAAEGYYAVGLAMRCPRTSVVAFEIESEGRMLMREMAQLNGVTNLDVRARCSPVELTQALQQSHGRNLVICDCEGYEQELLDLDAVPALRSASILVELHEIFSRGINQCIRARFGATHTIEEIWGETRRPEEFPLSPTFYTRLLPQKYILYALSEARPERPNWFWMKPKTE
jgi:hypothetical protein